MSKRGGTKTLDTQHNSKLTQFQEQQEHIQEKENTLEEVKRKLQFLKQTALSNLSENDFQSYLDLTDEQTALEKEIISMKKACEEIDYYVVNADIIFKYYDIVENGNVAENETAATVTEHSILKFFSSHKDTDNAMKDDTEPIQQDEDRASLLDRYMQHTDENYLRSLVTEESDQCAICESKDRTVLINDGIVMCNKCYTIETVIIDHEKPSYKDRTFWFGSQKYVMVCVLVFV